MRDRGPGKAERDPILSWRIERLRDAGFTARLAQRIARSADYDLHELLALTDRGCPADLAARITAPLEHVPEKG